MAVPGGLFGLLATRSTPVEASAIRRPIQFAVLLLVASLSADTAAGQGPRYVSPIGEDADNACVDAERPCRSIQRALSVAEDADTLFIAPGTFYETGLVLNKNLTLVGSGSDETVVDGDGRSGSRAMFLADVRDHFMRVRNAQSLEAGKKDGRSEAGHTLRLVLKERYEAAYGSVSSGESAVILHVEENVTAQLEGMSIRDGGGFISPKTHGGIVNDGDLTLRDVQVVHNIAYHDDVDEPSDYGKGGGILNHGSLSIHNSSVRDNLAVGALFAGGRGGGIFSHDDLTMFGSVVSGNETWDIQDECRGGGLVSLGSAEIQESQFERNSSTCFEGGIGGGIYNEGSMRIDRSVVGGNEALANWDDTGGSGGGIASIGLLDVINSTFSQNRSGSGGGIFSSGTTLIVSSTIADNDAEDREYAPGDGGGIRNVDSAITMWNTIVVGNRAGGASIAGTADCSLDDGAAAAFLLVGDQTGCPTTGVVVNPESALTDVFGGRDDADAGDYTYIPRAGGPAIDSGDCERPDGIRLTGDQRGKERPFDDPSVPDLSDGCDIGAVELQRAEDDNSSGTGVAAERGEIPRNLELRQNYPNPFRSETQIEFTLPQGMHASLVIFDLSGREVARLVAGRLSGGNHQVSWNASGLSSGVYVYRLTAGSVNVVRRMIVLNGSV